MGESTHLGPDAVELVRGEYVFLREAQSPNVEHFDLVFDGMMRLLEEHGTLPVVVYLPDGQVPHARLRHHMWKRFRESEGGWGDVAVVCGFSKITHAALRFSARILGMEQTRFFETLEQAEEWLRGR